MLRAPLRSLPLLLAACSHAGPAERTNATLDPVLPSQRFEITAGKPVGDLAGETRLRRVRQLTFDGENAEAYWSNDGRRLILQRTAPPHQCDQIFVLDLQSGELKLVSTGKGRTTCAYFLQGDDRILYASTHHVDERCPPPVMRVRGKYVWPIYASYDLFVARPDGSGLQRLTDSPGYDAEATACPVTGRLVFTSVRDGDLELYSMEPDGSDLKRLTNRLGYDGGAFFSHDGTKLVLRSQILATPDDEREYREFFAQHMVVPTRMELTVVDRDGSGFRQITKNGKANFAPYWLPDDRRIIFASNVGDPDPRGRDFELYVIDESGENLERITHNPTFDGFPMFSPDGRHLVFASNRYAAKEGETNIFVAEWVEN
jgi:Tol biopolymer transport system component